MWNLEIWNDILIQLGHYCFTILLHPLYQYFVEIKIYLFLLHKLDIIK